MASSKALEDRLKAFQEWVDGPSGIKRPKEIRLVAAENPDFGFIGVLDLSSGSGRDSSDTELEPSAKRQV
jgi:hypothetical protein